MIGVSTKTLREWDKKGKIKCVRTSGSHRRIPLSEIERIQGLPSIERNISLVYCRVSTRKQSENLERQIGRVVDWCLSNSLNIELYKDIGSGLNEHRSNFKNLLKRISNKDVKQVIVEYKDRISRFGFETFVTYCKNFGVDVVVLNDAEPKEFEQELVEDIISIVTSYSARLYGRRGGRKSKK